MDNWEITNGVKGINAISRHIIYAGGLDRNGKPYFSIFGLDAGGKAVHLLELPSGNDTSYPGMIVVGKELWISYYSGHEGKTSIYLAKLNVPHA